MKFKSNFKRYENKISLGLPLDLKKATGAPTPAAGKKFQPTFLSTKISIKMKRKMTTIISTIAMLQDVFTQPTISIDFSGFKDQSRASSGILFENNPEFFWTLR
ncbi:MAG: hypothetical protein JJU02_10910 [Cryomorphaceae bacterium]|nr:hypothetical protein [Cryomorphaceae bacterium]